MALVIGNQDYPWAPLKNPLNDAKDVAAALERDGFAHDHVVLLTNTTSRELRHGISGFLAQVHQDDFVFVYYSGHGVEVNGVNYLVPVDLAKDVDESDIDHDGYSAKELLRSLNERGVSTKVLVLDACRNNPLRKSGRDLSGGGGLARMDGLGTLVVFATEEGKTASDNSLGRNGLFTQYLLKALAMKGTSLDTAMTLVARQMASETKQRQVPAMYGLLQQPVILIDGPVTVNVAVATASDASAEAWNLIKDSKNTQDFDDYVRDWPDSPYSKVAKAAANRYRRASIPVPDTNSSSGSANPTPPVQRPTVSGVQLEESGNSLWRLKRYAEAKSLFQQSCDLGEMKACSELAIMYHNGQGVPQDARAAASLHEKACNGGFLNGCTSLGTFYEEGEGVPKDFARALTLHGKACDGGNMLGCLSLGQLYRNGNGVPKDPGRAMFFIDKACDGGVVMACTVLGLMYENGDGVTADASRADSIYRKTCSDGDYLGCQFLGWNLVKGIGIAVDRSEGLRLLHQTCDGGHSWACDRLRALGEK
jgi:TPR repeat protein